ncbi:MAG: 1-acyl-sn-glycerol-3-phosphate acyltransferase [Bacteroidales bacterium]|nr:1-acyl-sn-glycerol-3-phosphate acyltransferase [Bacteroidales bacterium]
MKNKHKPSLGYRLFKFYVRCFHDRIYYRKTYTIDSQNVPAPGTPTLIATNHQNGANDMLGIVMAFHDRKPNVIARADAFTILPAANVVLRALGLLPAFRIDFEGQEALGKNVMSFKVSEQTLLDGGTVVITPEGGHEQMHWLGPFSYGYTRMAFEAAQEGNFEKEIFILPACNHYDRHNGMRISMLVRYGTPISLAPYYELYKTKPRTAQREVGKLVREQIHDMMLSVDDVDNYESIDYIRTSQYGIDYAKASGIDPRDLPKRLESDKKLVAELAGAKEASPKTVQDIYDDVMRLLDGMYAIGLGDRYWKQTKVKSRGLKDSDKGKAEMKSVGLNDRYLEKSPNLLLMLLQLIAALILLPLGVFCLWPGVVIWGTAQALAFGRMKDKMMEGTFSICLGILVWIPLLAIITIVLSGIFVSWWSGFVWLLFLPGICWFAWTYWDGVVRLCKDLRFLFTSRSKVRSLRSLRKDIFDRLDRVLGKK